VCYEDYDNKCIYGEQVKDIEGLKRLHARGEEIFEQCENAYIGDMTNDDGSVTLFWHDSV